MYMFGLILFCSGNIYLERGSDNFVNMEYPENLELL